MEINTNSKSGVKVWKGVTKLNILDNEDFKVKWWEYLEIIGYAILLVLPLSIAIGITF